MSQHTLAVLDQVIKEGIALGVGHHVLEDTELTGREMTLDGRRLVNFGSCSYLGLEKHPALIEGTIDALRRFGTQFSSSRTYASLGLYAELEGALSEMFGQPTLVTASTTLGHLATLPVLVGDSDAVILDMQVHASVQMATEVLRAQGVPVAVIRHNDMRALERKVRDLSATHPKVWYLADGIYSMYGDSAPLDALMDMLARHERMHLYVDDAHGMSWAGVHGTGHVRSRIPHHPRMMLTVSLNKAFASAGGAMVFPDLESAQAVRNCGPTLMFSGPIQPPMLGAAVASARLHLSAEITELQARLARRVAFMNETLAAAGMPQLVKNDSPLFFVPAGTTTVNYTIMKRMFGDGFYLNSAVYPAVPMRRGGLRFTVTNHLSEADIEAMVRSMSVHYRAVLKEHGLTMDDVHRTFRIPPVGVHPLASPAAVAAHPDTLQLGARREADAQLVQAPAVALPA